MGKSDFELGQSDQIKTGESLQEEQGASSSKETFDPEDVNAPHTGEVQKSNEESRALAEDELEVNTSLDQDPADRVQESLGITSSSNKKGSLRSNTKVQPKNL